MDTVIGAQDIDKTTKENDSKKQKPTILVGILVGIILALAVNLIILIDITNDYKDQLAKERAFYEKSEERYKKMIDRYEIIVEKYEAMVVPKER